MYEELLQLHNNEQDNPLKQWANVWTDTSSKSFTVRWLIIAWSEVEMIVH